jgi:hypothetical protein
MLFEQSLAAATTDIISGGGGGGGGERGDSVTVTKPHLPDSETHFLF